jgi:NhaA family Na+:H+ antiporter
VRKFLQLEAAGAVLLLVAAVVALVWANAGGASYERLWHWHDLDHVVNEGLMAIFFFIVGLEIKRELVTGELRSRRQASTPVLAALGGMVVPAGLFLAVNGGGRGAHGWGIPMATDIAFALGVATLLGRRVPPGLKLFLLALAIVDDLGAITVIAVFYATDVRLWALVVAVLAVGGLALLRTIGARHAGWLPVYGALGVSVWLAVRASGVHATIAGVVLALLVPAAAAERVERALHPWSSLFIVPVFALANTGVVLEAAAFEAPGTSRVALGVGAGLVAGKLVGVTLGAYAAVRLGVGALPDGVTWRHVVGAAALAGIGFTVSLFVTDLAFPTDASLRAASKFGILAASVAASVIGAAVLTIPPRTPASAPRPAPTPR